MARPRRQAGSAAGSLRSMCPRRWTSKLQARGNVQGPTYDLPLPEPIDWEDAFPVVMSPGGHPVRPGKARRAQSVPQHREISARRLKAGKIAAIFHIEGAQRRIDAELNYAGGSAIRRGCSSIGPVWSRSTMFGHGVPFRYPSDPDIGPGPHRSRAAAGSSAATRWDIMLDLVAFE